MRDELTIRPRVQLFGIPIDRTSRIEFRSYLSRAIAGRRLRRLITLNPEIALAAYADQRYRATVQTADAILVDGIGILFALRLLGKGDAERIIGRTVLEDLCAIAAEQGSGIVFLLRSDGLTSPPLLRNALKERWPTLHVAIATVDFREPLDPQLSHAIAHQEPAALVVNFGHPAQETWIAENVDHFPSVRVAVGIGGAIDYFSGAVAAPPSWIGAAGLEWSFRLFRQPRRWHRIVKATIIFPLAVAWSLIPHIGQRPPGASLVPGLAKLFRSVRREEIRGTPAKLQTHVE
ncbi:MAG: WecB/TagA/CpsF family glycosyltransferase [Candidatus Uhrbacteria bacterium]